MFNFWHSVKNKKTFKETINNQKLRGKPEIRKRPTEDPNNDKQIFKTTEMNNNLEDLAEN